METERCVMSERAAEDGRWPSEIKLRGGCISRNVFNTKKSLSTPRPLTWISLKENRLLTPSLNVTHAKVQFVRVRRVIPRENKNQKGSGMSGSIPASSGSTMGARTARTTAGRPRKVEKLTASAAVAFKGFAAFFGAAFAAAFSAAFCFRLAAASNAPLRVLMDD